MSRENENDLLGVADESGPLLPAASGRRSTSRISEYESIGLTVVLDTASTAGESSSCSTRWLQQPQDQPQQPVIMHDFTGPILTASATASLLESLQQQQRSSGSGVDMGSDHASDNASDAASAILERLSMVGGDSAVEDSLLAMDGLPPSDLGGQATVASEIASMSKNLIGCGCLSLSNGIARCANAPRAVWTANAWIVLLGFIFGYFCFLIAKICHITGRTTYRGIWEDTVGHKGSLAVSVANALKAAMADLAYATILSDTLRSLLLGFFGWDLPRVACLLVVTIGAILPLCLLKNLNVLAPFSLLGTAGVMFTAGSMIVRYADGSYRAGGKFYDDVPGNFKPSFSTVDESWSAAILPFVCMVYEVTKLLNV
jgi:hypothetical protein